MPGQPPDPAVSGPFSGPFSGAFSGASPSDAVRRALVELVAAEARARGPRTGSRGPGGTADTPPEAELAQRLDAVCRAAHDAGLPVERVLVMLKELWMHDPDTRLVVRSDDPRLAALVSACIASYYRDHGGAADRP